jgi:regulator of cell morphogenesis and NO signaling
MITSETHVSAIVRENPALSRVFEGIGIDYCCAGAVPLDEACRKRGLDTATLLTVLNAQSAAQNGDTRVDGLSVRELIEHIVSTHHAYLRREVPRLEQLTQKIAKGHGDDDPRLVEVEKVFHTLVLELMPHQDTEENEVFPLLTDGADGSHAADVSARVAELEAEHELVGGLLARIRELTDGYEPPEWACNTTRAMFHGLAELEADVHRHIHKENHILFPRITAGR